MIWFILGESNVAMGNPLGMVVSTGKNPKNSVSSIAMFGCRRVHVHSGVAMKRHYVDFIVHKQFTPMLLYILHVYWMLILYRYSMIHASYTVFFMYYIHTYIYIYVDTPYIYIGNHENTI